jgi:hypothetical protein
MEKRVRRLALVMSLVALGFLVSACSSGLRIESEVTTFHKLGTFVGTPVAIVPAQEQSGSLEWETYADQLSRGLTLNGFVLAPPDKARYLVMFDYFIGEPRVQAYTVPIFGQTGVSSATTVGTVSTYGNTSTITGTTTYTPTYGIKGVAPVQNTVFERGLVVAMFENSVATSGGRAPVYEAKVRSVGSSGNLARVVPHMIDALFEDFPGASGRTIQTSAPFE